MKKLILKPTKSFKVDKGNVISVFVVNPKLLLNKWHEEKISLKKEKV